MKFKNVFIVLLLSLFLFCSCSREETELSLLTPNDSKEYVEDLRDEYPYDVSQGVNRYKTPDEDEVPQDVPAYTDNLDLARALGMDGESTFLYEFPNFKLKSSADLDFPWGDEGYINRVEAVSFGKNSTIIDTAYILKPESEFNILGIKVGMPIAEAAQIFEQYVTPDFVHDTSTPIETYIGPLIHDYGTGPHQYLYIEGDENGNVSEVAIGNY